MAATVNQGMTRASSKQSRLSPQQQDPRSATGTPGTDTSSPAPNGPLEVVGPWFPSEDLPVPFYHNQHQEQLLQHRANSFHVPRSPAPHSPLPRPPPTSSPPLPPPKGALPKLPPGAPRSKSQRQVAELAGSNHAPEIRHVAAHYSPQRPSSRPASRPDHHRDAAEPHHTRQRSNTAHSNATHKPTRSHPSADYAHEAAQRQRAASEQESVLQPPQSADAWNTSYYVPSTPPSTSGQSSQRTSFQPSSLDSAPSRDTYRSSVSTGPLSNVDSLSPKTSPRTQLPPTFENTAQIRPPSPKPSTTTTRSSGSAGKGASSFMDKMPGVFRSSKRKSLQSSDMSAQTTYRNSVSTNSSSTVDQGAPIGPTASALARRAERQIDIVPAEGLSDGKGPGIHHVEISPTGSTIATQHANNTIKVWSITTGAVDGLIKYSSKVTPGPRSRMYFLRPHAILSENSTLVAITASYGNTIEVWNWTKKKKVQSIDYAARWACYPGDVFEANMRPIAVYRSDADRIDLYTASRDGKKPFNESRRIILKNADLPFVPKFPDLAYSATGPLLVGAAGPRPGAPPEAQQTILLAWQIDEQQGENPRPYRWVVPEHAELSGALPAALATYGSVAVSIWFPANYRHVITARGESKKIPIPTPSRHVLVWDLATNRTRFFSIPNVLSCISPDCRYVAYCAPEQNRFAVLDVASGLEVWSGPDELDLKQAGSSTLPAASRQLLGDLSKVSEFRFTDDSGLLHVADVEGGVGIYEVRQAGGGGGRNGSVSTASGSVAPGGAYGFGEMGRELGRVGTGEGRG
ncbi:hypothetical protein GE09DRAFT_1144058 [Coniochaeta sp. 2T2.1]|nr:hypothetical protein GE09DRAFT_1144058 [Coniochaeta sp. 2T2.1]